MKKIALLLFSTFALSSFGQTVDNQFQKDLDFVYENLKRTASYQTQKERHAAVESKYEELKQKGPDYDPCTVESYIKLYELVDQLVDNHNAVRGNTKTFAYKDLSDEAFLRKIKSDPAYNFYPRAKMDLDSLETALSTRKTEDYEGIYYREPYFKIAIFKKEEGLLQGVILDTKIPSWERGEPCFGLQIKEMTVSGFTSVVWSIKNSFR